MKPPQTGKSKDLTSLTFSLFHWRIGHRRFIRANRERLQRLADIELAVLLVRIQIVEPLDCLVGRHVAHRELSRELMDDSARALPMKQIGRRIQHVELADADSHRVRIAIDVTILGSAIKTVPETAIMTDVSRSKSDSPASHKAQHHAGGEFLHFAMFLPDGNLFSKITKQAQNWLHPIWGEIGRQ